MTIQVTAFRWVPPFAQGYARDLRVRWALEEAGLPYEARLIDAEVQALPSYRGWQPLDQAPTCRDGEVEMSGSGAIVLHISARSEALAPKDPAGRARVTTRVVAALNSIAGSERRPPRGLPRRRGLDRRLEAFGAWLGGKEYLADRFTAGDLTMTTVLRRLGDSGFLSRFATLDAYRRRCEARPAFSRALEAQMKPFREHAPA